MDVISPARSAQPTEPAPPAQPTFYYDIGDPGCYLVAERIMAELGGLGSVAEWEPVHGAQLGFQALGDLDPGHPA